MGIFMDGKVVNLDEDEKEAESKPESKILGFLKRLRQEKKRDAMR